MSNPTYIKLTGWVTKDPKLRRTNGDQTAVCTIRIGTANRWPDKVTGDWREGPPSYFDVVCWRSLAENVAASLRKGHMITIHGTFRNRVWTDKDDNSRTTLEITANSVGHEMAYGWSHFNRMYRPSQGASGGLGEGEASRGLESGTGSTESGTERERAGEPGPGRREVNPFQADDGQMDLGPAAGPAYEPAGERVFGTGDEGGDADTAEAAAGEPRLEEVAVPV